MISVSQYFNKNLKNKNTMKGGTERIKSFKLEFFVIVALILTISFCTLQMIIQSILPIFTNDFASTYSSFEISDWMINYEGGFVRRGLIGEVLLLLYNVHSYDVKLVIHLICAITILFAFLLVFRVCKKCHISAIPFLIVYTNCFVSAVRYRRDFLILILCFYIFLFFTKYLATNKNIHGWIATILITLSILIHEASFFFTIPILILIFWFNKNSDVLSRKNKLEKYKKVFFLFFLPIAAMALSCLMKGTGGQVASDIWESWMPAFIEYPERQGIPRIGNGVAFLNNDLMNAIHFHLEENYHIFSHSLSTCLQRILSVGIALTATYFIMKYNLRMDLKNKEVYIENRSGIGIIVLIQFIAMIPMFTILSCDFGRTILYCVVSTIFIYYAIDVNKISINCQPIIQKKTFSLDNSIINNRYILWLYIITVSFYPIRAFGGIEFPIDCFLNKFRWFVFYPLIEKISLYFTI